MNDSYLWNKEGPKDPLVDGLVSKLSAKRPVTRRGTPMLAWLTPLASAAALVLVAVLSLGDSPVPPPSPGSIDHQPKPEGAVVVKASPEDPSPAEELGNPIDLKSMMNDVGGAMEHDAAEQLVDAVSIAPAQR